VIVVDASALATFILKEPGWKVMIEYIKYCISVDHILKEVSNAIWKAHTVRGIIDDSIAKELYNLLKSLVGINLILEPEEKYLDRAYQIALKSGITVYDALYVALALERKLPLLSLDNRQRNVAKLYGLTCLPL